MTNSFFDTVRVFVLSFINTKKIRFDNWCEKRNSLPQIIGLGPREKVAMLVVKQFIFLLKNLPENGVYFAKKRTPFTIFKNYIFQNEPWC